MSQTTNPPLSKRQLTWYGQFGTTNSSDPQVLYAKMSELKRGFSYFKIGAWLFTIVGALTSILIVGLPFLFIGILLLIYVYRNTSAISSAYKRYCADHNIQSY
jgi:hypothetical protein